jgi:hypothetical protein
LYAYNAPRSLVPNQPWLPTANNMSRLAWLRGLLSTLSIIQTTHIFSLCSDAQPSSSSADGVLPQGPYQTKQQVPLPSYKTIFAYARNPFMSHLASLVRDNHNRVAPRTTPVGVKPDIDLALRLGPTLRTYNGSTIQAGLDDYLVARFKK